MLNSSLDIKPNYQAAMKNRSWIKIQEQYKGTSFKVDCANGEYLHHGAEFNVRLDHLGYIVVPDMADKLVAWATGYKKIYQ
jgi:hypothetical protein